MFHDDFIACPGIDRYQFIEDNDQIMKLKVLNKQLSLPQVSHLVGTVANEWHFRHILRVVPLYSLNDLVYVVFLHKIFTHVS